MTRILVLFVSQMFSSVLWASSNGIYFPGPAQAPDLPASAGYAKNCGPHNPKNAKNCLQITTISTIYQPDKNPVEVGFDHVFQGDGVTCNDYGDAPRNPCVKTSSKAADKGLTVLKKKSAGGVLEDNMTYPLDHTQTVHHFDDSTPNYHTFSIRNESKVTFSEGTYYFGYAEFKENVDIIVNGPVEIHVNSLKLYDNVKINIKGEPKNLTLWVHQEESEDWLYSAQIGSDSVIYGYIYSVGTVKLAGTTKPGTWGTTIYGAVTAKSLILANESIIKFGGVPEGYKLSITPDHSKEVGCERVPLTFTVEDSSGQAQPLNGTLIADVTTPKGCFATSEDPDADCKQNHSITLDVVNGVAYAWLGGGIGDVYISAVFHERENKIKPLKASAGPYNFGSLGFSFNDGEHIKLVAGKPENLKIQFLKSIGQGNSQFCDIKNLDGAVKFTVTRENISPDVGVKPVVLNGVDVVTSSEMVIDFKGGAANIPVSYNDAGSLALTFTLHTEENYKNNKNRNHNFKGKPGGDIDETTSTAFLYSRPYTLAICGQPTANNVESDLAFKKAGEPFALNLKPVIWTGGSDLTGYALKNGGTVPFSQNLCSREMTPNFWHNHAPLAFVSLDERAELLRPAGGISAYLDGILYKENTKITLGDTPDKARYSFNQLRIGEVGVFAIRSRLQGAYLHMAVNPNEKKVGRFYPSHFLVEGSIEPGIKPKDDTFGRGFTYLNQPFTGEYTVHAMSVDNQKLKNYHLTDNVALFDDWAVYPSPLSRSGFADFTSRWLNPNARLVGTWGEDADGYSEYEVSGNMMAEKGAEPDGPFNNLQFAVGVAKPDTDGTDFKYCDEKLSENCNTKLPAPNGRSDGAEFAKGEFLFGRMRMEGFTDTKPPFTEQIMPVAVEVFDGGKFVTNDRDNASVVSTLIGQKDILFSSTDDANLQAKILLKSEDGKTVQTLRVKNGTSAFHVTAPQQGAKLNREQFRYWQLLGKTEDGVLPQPWLQHNWQGGQFTDDPSAVGTFGVYRGSDRVIYKGEKNITLTGE